MPHSVHASTVISASRTTWDARTSLIVGELARPQALAQKEAQCVFSPSIAR